MENTDCNSLFDKVAFLDGLADAVSGKEARRKGMIRAINKSYDAGYIKGAEIRADVLRMRHK